VLKAWASTKSFRPKSGSDENGPREPPSPGRKVEADFRSTARRQKGDGVPAMSLWAEFLTNDRRVIHKWTHYFPIYEHHFARYVNRPMVFLEIG
jgi:hypothetical protein